MAKRIRKDTPLEVGTGGSTIKGGVQKLLREGNSGIETSSFTQYGFLRYNPWLKKRSNELRYDHNLPEILLWNQLKRDSLGVDFHRQKAIGNFVVDLFCPELMLAIEIDGKIHEQKEVAARDQARQELLEARGIEFLRFRAGSIFRNMDWVVKKIKEYVEKNKVGERLTQLERGVYNKNKEKLKDKS
jgi:very-short-patch-repair endonuclease